MGRAPRILVKPAYATVPRGIGGAGCQPCKREVRARHPSLLGESKKKTRMWCSRSGGSIQKARFGGGARDEGGSSFKKQNVFEKGASPPPPMKENTLRLSRVRRRMALRVNDHPSPSSPPLPEIHTGLLVSTLCNMLISVASRGKNEPDGRISHGNQFSLASFELATV